MIIKELPAWSVLFVLLLVLLGLYQVRPDATSEDAVKAVLGALLLSLRSAQPPPLTASGAVAVEATNSSANPVITEETKP